MERSLETGDFRQLGSPGPLPPKRHSIRGSHLHWREMNRSDLLSCENTEQWPQWKTQGRCTAKAGKALDGDVRSCCCGLPTSHSSLTSALVPQREQLGAAPAPPGLMLQEDAGPSPGSRKRILVGPEHVLAAQHPSLSDWQVSRRRKPFCHSFTEAAWEELSFLTGLGCPPCCWQPPRGQERRQAWREGGSLGHNSECRGGKNASWIHSLH